MNKQAKILFIVVVMIMVMGVGAAKYWPRGIRNNNPGNIKHNAANDWVGMTGQDKDNFVIFSRPEFGIRAMGRIFDSYQRRGLVNLKMMIDAWAPAEENDNDSYLAHVMQLTGWQWTHMPLRAEGDYHALVKAIIKHENGRQPYTDELITAALALA